MVCDDIVCPKPNCVKPFLPEGTCCPVCNETQITTNTGSGCFLEGDQVLHTPGSRWHPYIPPFGFSRCATCTCKVSKKFAECEVCTFLGIQMVQTWAA